MLPQQAVDNDVESSGVLVIVPEVIISLFELALGNQLF
jgi:hypothetical protein